MGTALLSFDVPSATATLPRFIDYQGGLLTVHLDSNDTGGQFALLEMSTVPGGEPPVHIHRDEDESFYVIEGELKILVGGEERVLTAGQSGFLPRNVPHTFRILSAHARLLILVTPGGFEDFFREIGEPRESGTVRPIQNARLDVERVMRVAGKYGVTFVR